MFRQHENTFATSPTDLGRCSVLKHWIDTAGAAPIRQPMCRTPQGFKQEEEKHLEGQIEAGVIRPSKSPWNPPVVRVRKKDGEVRWCIDCRRFNDVTVKDPTLSQGSTPAWISFRQVRYFQHLTFSLDIGN